MWVFVLREMQKFYPWPSWSHVMAYSSTCEEGRKIAFGERKRAHDQGKQSLLTEAGAAARSHSSPDLSGLASLALDHTRLACPKTQPPGSLFARNVGNGQLLLVQCCNVEPTIKHWYAEFHHFYLGRLFPHSESKYLPIVWLHVSWWKS